MQDVKTLALALLYKWVSDKKIPHIRAGMAEELEGLVLAILADKEAKQAASRNLTSLENTKNQES